MLEFKPGDRVLVRYDHQPTVEAIVIDTPEQDAHFGWTMVEQVTDFEDYDIRPRYLALTSMIRPYRG